MRESEDYQLQISSIHIVMDKLPDEIKLPSGQESICFTFIMSIDVTKERSLAQYTEGELSPSNLCCVYVCCVYVCCVYICCCMYVCLQARDWQPPLPSTNFTVRVGPDSGKSLE